MEGVGGNEWKFIRSTILNRFWQNNTENCLRNYFHLLKSPNFRLQVFRSDGSYLRVFTVYVLIDLEMEKARNRISYRCIQRKIEARSNQYNSRKFPSKFHVIEFPLEIIPLLPVVAVQFRLIPLYGIEYIMEIAASIIWNLNGILRIPLFFQDIYI